MIKTNGYNIPTLYLEYAQGGSYQTEFFSREEIINYCNLMRNGGIVKIISTEGIIFGYIKNITLADIPTILLVNDGITVNIIHNENETYQFNILIS